MLFLRHFTKFSSTTVRASKKNVFLPLLSSRLRNTDTVKQFSTNKLNPEDSKKANWQGRVDLPAALRGFAMLNYHEGICNHLSVIVPAANGDGEVMLINNYGYHWSEAEPETLLGVSKDGETVEGKGRLDKAAKTIHLGVHLARPDARCVGHLHTPYTTALGFLKDPSFGMYHQNSMYFYDDIAYDNDYSGFSEDLDEGQRTGKALKDKNVLFMCNHGVMVLGNSVAEMFYRTYFLERACMYQVLAMSTGRELREIDEDVCKLGKKISIGYLKTFSVDLLDSFKRLTGIRDT